MTVASGVARADTVYYASENTQMFGHFDQNATNTTVAPNGTNSNFLITPDNPGVSAMAPAACGPTSAANSFIYLQNQYGVKDGITGLVNLGNPYGTISDIAASMNTGLATSVGGSQTNYQGGGTYAYQFVQGKEAYLKYVAPAGGFTSSSGQQYAIQTVGQSAYYSQTANGPWEGGVTKTTPTAAFIQQQLAAGEDVEMVFNWRNSAGGYSGAGAHYVTLTRINYNATSNSGYLSFIDPTNSINAGTPFNPIYQLQYGTGDAPNIDTGTPADPKSSLQMINGGPFNGFLRFSYTGGASGVAADDNSGAAGAGVVVGVFAESPVLVPEPAAVLLIAAGAVPLFPILRRRKAGVLRPGRIS